MYILYKNYVQNYVLSIIKKLDIFNFLDNYLYMYIILYTYIYIYYYLYWITKITQLKNQSYIRCFKDILKQCQIV